MAQRLKLAEIGVALIAIVGFVTHSVPILFLALFCFGVIGSLFGPIKYGILPDHLARSELPAGNALVEGATFLAILLGTIVGGLAAKDGGDPASFAGLMIVFALLCWGSSLFIPRTGEGAPDLVVSRNIAASTIRLLQHLRTDERLLWGALVTSWFWLVGAVVLSLLPPLVKSVLGGTEEVITVYLAVFSVAGRGRLRPGGMDGGRPHRDPADAGRRGAAGGLRHRSRLDHLWRAAGADARRRSARCSPRRAAST